MASLRPPDTLPDWDSDKLPNPTFDRKLPPLTAQSSAGLLGEDDLTGSKQGKKLAKEDKGGIFGKSVKKK